jgi:menaquinone-dependent protoporphyrinogen oxidase
MNVLVAFASRLGSTEGIARCIADRLRSRGVAAIARAVGDVEYPAVFDATVVGSAVYAGNWLPQAVTFVERNRAILAAHPVWLFSSGPVGRAAAHAPSEPPEIRDLTASVQAKDHRTFAGALDRRTVEVSDLGFGERFIARRFVPEGDFRDWRLIEGWADEIADALLRGPSRSDQPRTEVA